MIVLKLYWSIKKYPKFALYSIYKGKNIMYITVYVTIIKSRHFKIYMAVSMYNV